MVTGQNTSSGWRKTHRRSLFVTPCRKTRERERPKFRVEGEQEWGEGSMS